MQKFVRDFLAKNIKINSNSLFFKYFKIIFGILFVPMFLFSSITIYYNISKSNSAQETYINNTLQLFSLSLDNILSNYNTINQQMLADNSIMNYLEHNSDIRLIEISQLNHISDSIQKNIITNGNYLDSILLCSQKNSYVLSNKYNNYIKYFTDTEWYKVYTASENNINIAYSTPLNSPASSPKVLSVMYSVYSQNKRIGVIVYNMNINEFVNGFKLSDGMTISIIDPNTNNTVFCSNSTNIHSNKAKYSQRIKCSNISVEITYANHNKPNYLFITLATFILCLLLTLLISYFISNVLYKTISKIVLNTYLITTGEIPNPDIYDEVITINNNLLSLSQQKDDIKDELIKNQEQLKSIQLYAMQTQINPHFLFNTLTSMYILANGVEYKNTRLADMIMILSDLLNASLDNSQMIISIHQELVYTKKYVDIAKIRDNDSFEFLWDVNTSLANCKIAKLSIQPLIENAIEHGLKTITNGKKEISLRVSEANDEIRIEVHDNGSPIPAEKLAEINERINQQTFSKQNIGLRNVNFRIKLAFGEKYGCKLESDQTGTTSIISLPKQ